MARLRHAYFPGGLLLTFVTELTLAQPLEGHENVAYLVTTERPRKVREKSVDEHGQESTLEYWEFGEILDLEFPKKGEKSIYSQGPPSGCGT